MAEVSRAALRDLREIFAWTLEQFGRAQAERYLLMLRSRIAAADAQPTLGPRFEDAAPDIRRIVSGSHFIYYREVTSGIRVLRILHQRMLQDLRLN